MLKNAEFKGKIFIIAAPSGAGKTSVTAGVISFLTDFIPIEKVVTFTTRKPRISEIPGRDYNFVSETKFLDLKKQGFFLETTEYGGNLYGSPSSIIPILKSGKSLIMITDCNGAKNLKKNILHGAVTIWLTVPSIEILRQRLEKRGTEDRESLIKRLKLTKQEIESENVEHFFEYHVLNDNLELAIRNVAKIIQQELGIIAK